MPNRDGTGPRADNRRGFGLGPDGNCVCPSCGATSSHRRGMPCYLQKCPKCGTSMTRE